MGISKDMQDELRELVTLVRRDERFAAVAYGGLLPIDHESKINHQSRVRRIKELSIKYGIM